MTIDPEFLDDSKLSEEEKNISSRAAFAQLLPQLKSHVKPLLFCFSMLVTGTLLSLYWPILLKRAFDVNIANRDFHGLVWTAVIIFCLQGLMLLTQFVQRVRLEIVGQGVMVELKRKLFTHIVGLDVSFFDRHPVGRLLARVESDTEALRQLFTITVIVLVGDVLLIIGTFIVMFVYSWRLASILLLVVPAVVVMIYVFQKKTTPRFLQVRRKMAEVTATLTEFLQGLAIVQIFDRIAYARKRLFEVSRAKFKNDAYTEVSVVAFSNIIGFLQYLMIGLVLYFGIVWTRAGTVTIGTMSMFIILIWRLFEPIFRTSEQLSNIQKAVAGAKRIFALLATKPNLIESASPVLWTKLEKNIRFENVWFSYTGDNFTLKNVSFDIPVGRRVALVGVTGGGKSTVINLMLRFYDPQRGRITVDGIDIRDISQQDLRRRFALVLQDIIIFPGDIRSNIAMSADSRELERIVSAAETVDADRFIRRLPKQYATEVSERGANFSRGERQLLSFARALVVNPDVLILDEATSSVDPETERTIQASLKKLMAGRTSLIIAHRLSTILDVDEILVIRHGEIVERGTHTELILANGYYSRLFHLQFKPRNGAVVDAR